MVDVDLPRVGEPLTCSEFNDIVATIRKHHRFGVSFENPNSRHVKYIRPHLDLCDDRVYRVEFKGFGTTTVFDFRDSDEPMYKRINEWLQGEAAAQGTEG